MNIELLSKKIIEFWFRSCPNPYKDLWFQSNKTKRDILDKTLTDDYGELLIFLETININAPIKSIAKNKKDEDIMIMFSEIVNELNRIELNKKIESLEVKVSANLDEKLYSELLSLRNQLKRG